MNEPGSILPRDARVRWLALAVVVLALVVGAGGIGVINLLRQQSAISQRNHETRLLDQQRTDNEIDTIIMCVTTAKKTGDAQRCLLAFLKEHPVPPVTQPKPSASGTPGAAGSAVSVPHAATSSRPSSSNAPRSAPSSAQRSAPTATPSRARSGTPRPSPSAPTATPSRARSGTPRPSPSSPTATKSRASTTGPKPIISVGQVCVVGVCVP